MNLLPFLCSALQTPFGWPPQSVVSSSVRTSWQGKAAAAAAMPMVKPPQLPAGEGGSWAHEVKQALRDKLRRSCGTNAAPAPRPAGEGRTTAAAAGGGQSRGADCRGSAAEDPIRRVMFLAPWGHT
jgi:hypothetical protein